MRKSGRLTCVAATILLLSACAAPVTPVPTPTPLPTPTPTLAPVVCLSGFDSYADGEIGFTACYPSGWTVSAYQGTEANTEGVDFSLQGAGATAPQRISVRAVLLTGTTDTETLLENLAKELMNQRAQQGREIVALRAFPVDGHKAVEDGQQGAVTVGGKPVNVSGWVVGFPANTRMWYINVSGAVDQGEQTARVYRQFLTQFHVLPR